ncbi:transposase [Actinospica durhamensis]|uniref:Transposase n=1 Tax=Actinospica durhamensis TaxID=1508375 RepID=A0A941EN68_9ACTN|nr:transposase family protein [Actinospica durhamensis]MBR7835505.1 transposase [Actinospica durhamensis]
MSYCVTLDVSVELVRFVARLLGAERRRVGTRRGTRVLTPFRQAVFGLARLRDRCDVERLGAGFGLSRATAYRYRDEFLWVLSDQAPDLQEAMERAKRSGVTHLILDGTVISCDRLEEVKISKKGREIDAWYAGKVRAFGGNLQALMDPNGLPLWVSDVLPGSVHDLTAARELVLAILWLYSKDMPVLADGGYIGAGCGVLTPVPQREDGIPLHADQRTYNKLLRGLRCLGERGFALLTERWKALEHVTASPRRITQLARAALVLVHFEHGLIS